MKLLKRQFEKYAIYPAAAASLSSIHLVAADAKGPSTLLTNLSITILNIASRKKKKLSSKSKEPQANDSVLSKKWHLLKMGLIHE